MKIFDSRWIGAHGIGRFAGELFERLAGFDPIKLQSSPAAPFDPFRLSQYLRRAPPNLFFSPGYNAPLGHPCAFAFCVHDLNHLVVKENSSAIKRMYYQRILRPAIRRARVVLTVSEFSRNQICEWADVSERQVLNVGNGVSEVFTAIGPSYKAERPYFLFVGNHKAHKNLHRLLAAFAAAGVKDDFMLLITGEPWPAAREQIDSLRLRDSVKFLGKVSDTALACHYRGATALAMVSLYEGFGLPVIEAMACGCPVLASTAASLPEIAGNDALFVDPFDIEAMTSGLQKLASDPVLCESLRRRGIERAKLYSWESTAQKVDRALDSQH